MQKISTEMVVGLENYDNLYTTSGTAPNYEVNIPSFVHGIGKRYQIKFHEQYSGEATLKINNSVTVGIKKTGGTDNFTNIKTGIYTFVDDGVNFQSQGEGGEYGTASPSEVLAGFTIGTESGLVSGTLALTGDAALDDVLSGKTFYNTNAKSKQTGTLALTGNAIASDVLSGKTFYNTNAKTKVTGTIPSKGAQIYTPSTVDQTIAANQFLSGAQTILGDADLIAANIKSGINIFGIIGTLPDGTGMKKQAQGLATPVNFYIHVTGLNFTPSKVMIIEYPGAAWYYVMYDSRKYTNYFANVNGVKPFDANNFVTAGAFKFDPVTTNQCYWFATE